MKLGYTEFSYGYAFTENLIRSSRHGPSSAPYFPNLIEEGRLGYDIRLELPASPLFFQFKLPELLTRYSAYEISTYYLPLTCDFFRMPLMRRNQSDQHQLLIALEATHPNAVYYASAALPDIRAFNSAYNRAEVHRRTAFISPTDIGHLPDDRSHVVSYNGGSSLAFFCSDPKKVEVHAFEVLASDIDMRLRLTKGDRAEEAVSRLLDVMRDIGGSRIRIEEDTIRQRFSERRTDGPFLTLEPARRELAENLFVAREIGRMALGVELVLAQPGSDQRISRKSRL